MNALHLCALIKSINAENIAVLLASAFVDTDKDGNKLPAKVNLLAGVGDPLIAKIKAGDWIKAVARTARGFLQPQSRCLMIVKSETPNQAMQRTASQPAISLAAVMTGSHHAVIRVYDEAGDVIETHEHAGDFKEW